MLTSGRLRSQFYIVSVVMDTVNKKWPRQFTFAEVAASSCRDEGSRSLNEQVRISTRQRPCLKNSLCMNQILSMLYSKYFSEEPQMSLTGQPLSPNTPTNITSQLQHSPATLPASSLERGRETQRQLQARLYSEHEVYSHSRPQLRVARRRPHRDEVSPYCIL